MTRFHSLPIGDIDPVEAAQAERLAQVMYQLAKGAADMGMDTGHVISALVGAAMAVADDHNRLTELAGTFRHRAGKIDEGFSTHIKAGRA